MEIANFSRPSTPGYGISSALAFQLVLLKMHSKRTETAPG